MYEGPFHPSLSISLQCLQPNAKHHPSPPQTFQVHACTRFSLLHLDILLLTILTLPQILQQIAALEVLIWMYDRLQLRSTPRSIIADFLDFLLMCVLKDPVSLISKYSL